jgi:diguanylate cyclase (GGDEF)-like protein
VLSYLDINTLCLMTAVTLVVVGVYLGMVWGMNRSVPGFLKYGLSMIAVGFGLVGLWLRQVAPGSLVILIPNLLVVIGTVEMAQALREFRGRSRAPRPVLIALYALHIGVMIYSLYIHRNFGLRAAESSTIVGCAALVSAAAMGLGVEVGERAMFWPAAFGYLVHGSILLAWAAIVATGYGGHRLFIDNPGQKLFILSIDLMLIFAGFGFSAAMNLQLRRRIGELAHYDALTRLPNRRRFDALFDEACRRALCHGHRLALVYMDIDNFKRINDTLGHDAGDEVLKLVAERLGAGLGNDDCLARLGGDEFVLLLQNGESEAEVAERARRLRGEVACEAVVAGRHISLAISCGYAFSAEEDESYYDLVRRADAAMYEVKAGRQADGTSVSKQA